MIVGDDTVMVTEAATTVGDAQGAVLVRSIVTTSPVRGM
jgi:hypothetical protein